MYKIIRSINLTLCFMLVLSSFTLFFSPYVAANETAKLDRNAFEEIVKEKLSKIQGGSKIDSKINLKSDEEIEVIVELQELPVIIQEKAGAIKGYSSTNINKAKENVKANHQELTDGMKRLNIPAKKLMAFENILNGAVLRIKSSDIKTLEKIDAVKKIYMSQKVYGEPAIIKKGEIAVNDTNQVDEIRATSLTGADRLWEKGYTGKGKKIAVIDTGIDYKHPDLRDAYKGGTDLVDSDNDPYEGNDRIPTYHGTHVSGIIAGRGNPEAGGMKGVAPDSDLYVYRVINTAGVGLDYDVIKAIDIATREGVDVINLSLGNKNNDSNDPLARAVNNAVLAGVVVVASNGNDGFDGVATVGAPGTSPLAISVGASTLPENQYIFTGTSTAVSNKTYSLEWLLQDQPKDEDIQPLNKDNGIVYIGQALKENLVGKDYSGKVLLAKYPLWVSAFNPHGFNYWVEQTGASAVILFNDDGYNEPLPVTADVSGFVPMFNMRGDDGRQLANIISGYGLKKSAKQPTFRLNDMNVIKTKGDELASFSSQGPVKDNYEIKPDIVAPGVNIRSTFPGYMFGDHYDRSYLKLSGTSMAAPHIAGMAALLLNSNPDWQPAEVKTAMMNTAVNVKPSDNTSYYSVFQQGSGRVQADQILNSDSLAQVSSRFTYDSDPHNEGERPVEVDYVTGSLNVGQIKSGNTITKKISLNGLKSVVDREYSISVSPIRKLDFPVEEEGPVFTNSDDEHGIDVSISKNNIKTGETIEVAIHSSESSVKGVYEGYITLVPQDDSTPNIRIPIGLFNDSSFPEYSEGIKGMSFDPIFLSVNNDDKFEQTNIHVSIDKELKVDGEGYYGHSGIYLMDTKRGSDLQGLIKPLTEQDLSIGEHIHAWDGTYTNLKTGDDERVKTGVYTIFVVGYDETGVPYQKSSAFYVINEPVEFLPQGDLTETGVIDLYENRLAGYLTSPLIPIWKDINFNGYFDYQQPFEVGYQVIKDDRIYTTGIVNLIEEIDNEIPVEYAKYEESGILPPGESKVILTYRDKAGNSSQKEYRVNFHSETSIESFQNKAKLGDKLKLTLNIQQVQALKESNFGLKYRSDVFSLDRVEVTPLYRSLSTKEIILNTTESQSKDNTRLINIDARIDDEDYEGYTGMNLPVVDVYFKVAKDVKYLDLYPFEIVEPFYKNNSGDTIERRGSLAHIEVYTDPAQLIGQAFLQAFLDKKGKPRDDISYSLHNSIYFIVKDSETGKVLNPLDGYSMDFGYGLDSPDASFFIQGLRPGKKYDVELHYSGHFTGVLKGVETAKKEKGVIIPLKDVEISFGLQLAGDTNQDEVIDIYDVATVAYFMGEKAVDGYYQQYLATSADINQDGEVNAIDLEFALENYGKWNRELLGKNGKDKISLKLRNGVEKKDIIKNLVRIKEFLTPEDLVKNDG